MMNLFLSDEIIKFTQFFFTLSGHPVAPKKSRIRSASVRHPFLASLLSCDLCSDSASAYLFVKFTLKNERIYFIPGTEQSFMMHAYIISILKHMH